MSKSATQRNLPREGIPKPGNGFVSMPEPSLHATETIATLPLDGPTPPGELGMFAGYRLLKLLGVGGMGVVFLAEETMLQRPVAIKIMKPEVAAMPEARVRFLREARAAAGLRSDHIITIFHVGEVKKVPFMAMELLDGQALDVWLRFQPRQITERDVTRIAQDVLTGLATAHSKGLVHRDIKPSNLWMDSQTGRVKLLDFGLTKQTQSDERSESGAIVGTPAYMSPEQADGQPVDGRADLFSLGVILYRLLTGVNPFQREGMLATLTALATYDPPKISKERPDVSEDLEAFVHKLMARDPNNRYTSAKAALQALSTINSQSLVVEYPDHPLSQTPPPRSVAINAIADHQEASPFSDLDEDEGEPTVALPSTKIFKVAPADTSTPNRGWLWMLLGSGMLLAVALLIGLVLIFIQWNNSARTVASESHKPELPHLPGGKPKPKNTEPANALIPAMVPAVPDEIHTLDHLDPTKHIPPRERFPWQPKELVAVLGSHRQRVAANPPAPTLSTDGKLVSVGTKIWNMTTREEQKTPYAEALSPNGKLLANGRTVFSVEKPDQPGTEYALPGYIIGFLEDDVVQVRVGENISVYILEKQAARLLTMFGNVDAVVLSPDRKYLATVVSQGGSVEIYDYDRTKVMNRRHVLRGPGSTVQYVGRCRVALPSFSANGRLAVLHKQVYLWDIAGAEAKLLSETKGQSPRFQFAVLHPLGDRVYSFSEVEATMHQLVDGQLKVVASHDIQAGIYDGILNGIATTIDGTQLVSSHYNGAVRFWSTANNRIREIDPLESQLLLHRTYSDLSPDGQTVAFFSENYETRLWNFSLMVGAGLQNSFFSPVRFSPSSRYLATASPALGNSARLIPVSPDKAAPFQFKDANFYPLAYSPDGNWLVTGKLGDSQNNWSIWSLNGGMAAPVYSRKDGMNYGTWRFSPDGRYLYAGSLNGNEFKSWAITKNGPEPRADLQIPHQSWNLSPDGNTILFCCAPNGYQYYNIKEGLLSLQRNLQGHPSSSWADYSPNGKLLLVCGANSADLVEPGDHGLIHRFPLHGTPIQGRFHPDGKHVLISNADRTLYILRIPANILAR